MLSEPGDAGAKTRMVIAYRRKRRTMDSGRDVALAISEYVAEPSKGTAFQKSNSFKVSKTVTS